VMADKVTTAELNRAIQMGLASLGFKKSGPQTCCVPLDPAVLGWVGFNHARMDDGSVESGPMIGIHSTKIHQLIAQLRNEKYRPCDPPTFVQNAGYLIPERRTYIAIKFENVEQLTERVQVFVDVVREVGLPFMRAHTEMAAICESLRQFKPLAEAEERSSVAEYLLGNRAAAKEIVETKLDQLKSEHPVMRVKFEKFSTPFLQLLASSV